MTSARCDTLSFVILGQIPLVPAADLKRELETLQYREHKRLAYQGQITAVTYLRSPKTPRTEGTEVSGLIFTWLFLLQILFV